MLSKKLNQQIADRFNEIHMPVWFAHAPMENPSLIDKAFSSFIQGKGCLIFVPTKNALTVTKHPIDLKPYGLS